MSHSISVDAEEVLTILNELGYRNITGKQLKEFIKDLKKLIKYEEKIEALPTLQREMEAEKHTNVLFAHLYSTATISHKAKAANNLKLPDYSSQNAEVSSNRKPTTGVKEIPTQKTVSTQTKENLLFNRDERGTMSVIQLNTPPEKDIASSNINPKSKNPGTENKKPSIENKRIDSGRNSNNSHQNKMWLRSRPASSINHIKKKDPVALYQFYKSCWDKFKDQLPGENDHTELRWKIRQKLLHDK